MGEGKLIRSHRELNVWRRAFDASMEIFGHSRSFPREETYSLTDQIRRSSRSVTTNITEAWRKRRYEAAFVAKLNDAEAEAAETQDWLEYAVKCGYLERPAARTLYAAYEAILKTLVGMITHADTWVLPVSPAAARRARRGP
ncbi:MAG: four helix bundle protein [Phycisphaerales bacterium]